MTVQTKLPVQPAVRTQDLRAGVGVCAPDLARGSTDLDALVGWIAALGAPRVRCRWPEPQWAREQVVDALAQLPDVKLLAMVSDLRGGDGAAASAAADTALGSLIDQVGADRLAGVGGPNEPNGEPYTDWPVRTGLAQQALWFAVQQACPGVPVHGPSLNGTGTRAVPPDERVARDAAAIGDLTGWMTVADTHMYPGTRDLEELAGTWQTALAPMNGDLPMVVSEYGWTVADTDPAAIGALTARAMLTHAAAGRQSYIFQMFDGGVAKDRAAGYGLFHRPDVGDPDTWEPTDAFLAVQSWLALLAGPGTGTAPPRGLRCSITGDTDGTLRHLVVDTGQHRLIALWHTRPIGATPQTVTVQFPSRRRLVLWRLGSPQSADLGRSATAQFVVGDGVTVLDVG